MCQYAKTDPFSMTANKIEFMKNEWLKTYFLYQ